MTATLPMPGLALERESSLARRLAQVEVDEFFRLSRELPHDKAGLEQLRFAGRFVRLITSHPDFPDRKLSASVEARCEAIDLEWQAFVNPLADSEADRILAQAGL